jgi:polar amino acid transport system substrate-binding protein
MFKILINQKTNTLLVSCLFFLSVLFNAASADSKVINIGSDPWCPFVCDIEPNHQGLIVDIAREALALSGFKLNFKLINWARAKQHVKVGTLDGIIGMTYNKKTASQYFFSKTQLAESQTCFYKRKNDEWQYQSLASLGNRTFGWINNYGYSNELLDNWIKLNKKTDKILTVAGLDTYPRLFKLLSLERIDTFAEDRNVIAYELKKAGLDRTVKVAGCLPSIDSIHLAFSLKAEQKKVWANALDIGVQGLKKSGRFYEILAIYGLDQKI